ncbi:MAG TPA: FtsX-like permease family protein [Cyclobacteriaceae bacterium]
MIRNYLLLALRNLLKRKVYSFINVAGLAIGIAVCLVIWKYVEFELSYDRFHTNSENIYRVASSLYTDGGKDEYTGHDLGPALLHDLPEIKSFTRTHANEGILSYQPASGDLVRFQESKMLFVDSTFLTLFSFDLIQGDASTALDKPNSIVMTASMADKYFDKNTDAIGKIVQLNEGWIEGQFEVTAIVKDLAENSSIRFDFLMPMHLLLETEFYKQSPRWDNFLTYIETYHKTDQTLLTSKIPAFIEKYKGSDKNLNIKPSLSFQHITDIHFSPDMNHEGSHLNTIYFFILISIFILTIAWINYVNLSTARAMERAKEVGVKKAIGVQRIQLIGQFIIESVMVNLLGIIVAVILAALLLPVLGDIVGRKFFLDFAQPQLWIILITLFVVGSFLSGAYPAFVLSSFKTVDVMKGTTTRGKEGLSLRKGLVVFQFTASLLLIAGTFTIYRQMNFMKSQDTGLDIEQTLILKGPHLSDKNGIITRMISFKNELKEITSVSKVTTSYSIPGGEANTSTLMRKSGAMMETSKVGDEVWVDPDFIETYGMKLIAGKIWNDKAPQMNAAIINEAALTAFGLGTAEQALNEKIIVARDTMSILGVVKNHHWNSLHKPFTPMLLLAEKACTGSVSIKLSGGNMEESVSRIEQKFKSMFPGNPYMYFFVDDYFNEQYKSEHQFGKIFSLFAMLAIIIACLGLGGLASFTTTQRIKEISIRKVLGASVNNIVTLLSSQFLQLILISGVIALPIIWYTATNWLNQFAYRISFSWDLFLLPVIGLLVIALLTVSILIFRGANVNPAKTLRSE